MSTFPVKLEPRPLLPSLPRPSLPIQPPLPSKPAVLIRTEDLIPIKQRIESEEIMYSRWLEALTLQDKNNFGKIAGGGVQVGGTRIEAEKCCVQEALVEMNQNQEKEKENRKERKNVVTLTTRTDKGITYKKDCVGLYLFLDSRQFPFRVKNFKSQGGTGTLLLLLSSAFKLFFLVLPEDFREVSLSKVRSGSVLWIKEVFTLSKETYSPVLNRMPSIAVKTSAPSAPFQQFPSFSNAMPFRGMPFMLPFGQLNSNTPIAPQSQSNPSMSGLILASLPEVSNGYNIPIGSTPFGELVSKLINDRPDLSVCSSHVYCVNAKLYVMVTTKSDQKKYLLFAGKSNEPVDLNQLSSLTLPQAVVPNNNSSLISPPNPLIPAFNPISVSSALPPADPKASTSAYYNAYYSQCVYAANVVQSQYVACVNQLNQLQRVSPAYAPLLAQISSLYSQYQHYNMQAQVAMMHVKQFSDKPESVSAPVDAPVKPEVIDSFSSIARSASSSSSLYTSSNHVKPVTAPTRSNSETTVLSTLRASSPVKPHREEKEPVKVQVVDSKPQLNSPQFNVILAPYTPSVFSPIHVAQPSPPSNSLLSNPAPHDPFHLHSPALASTPALGSVTMKRGSISHVHLPSHIGITPDLKATSPAPLGGIPNQSPNLQSLNFSPTLQSANFINSLSALQQRMHPNSSRLNQLSNFRLGHDDNGKSNISPILQGLSQSPLLQAVANSPKMTMLLNYLGSPGLGGLTGLDDHQWSTLESSPEIAMALQLVANSEDMNSEEMLEFLAEVGLKSKSVEVTKLEAKQEVPAMSLKSTSPDVKPEVKFARPASVKKEKRKEINSTESTTLCFSHKNIDILVSSTDAIPLIKLNKSSDVQVLEPSGKITKNMRSMVIAETEKFLGIEDVSAAAKKSKGAKRPKQNQHLDKKGHDSEDV